MSQRPEQIVCIWINGKCKETCGGDSCLYNRSVIIMLLSAVVYNVLFCGKEGRKKCPKNATRMLCKYFVHCRFGSMIEGFGLLGRGLRGKGVLPFLSNPESLFCLLLLLGLLANIGIMESF